MIMVAKTKQRRGNATIQDLVDEDVRLLRRQEALTDDLEARAHAAEVEIEIKTSRASSLRQQATESHIKVAAAREELNDMKSPADSAGASLQRRTAL